MIVERRRRKAQSGVVSRVDWIAARPSLPAALPPTLGFPRDRFRLTSSQNADMEYESETLVRDDTLRIDYFFQSTPSCGNMLVFTFTERDNISLDGTGFGGEFLLQHGCDVVAIKSISRRWFEDLDSRAISIVTQAIAGTGERYPTKAAYGSSMGGYAAMRYANDLGIDRVVAISPLFRIGTKSDRRYGEDIPNLSDPEMMRAAHVNENCRYYIIYDSLSIDKWHADSYRQIIPEQNFIEIKLPFSGHPSGRVLAETNILKPFMTKVLLEGNYMGLRDLQYDRYKSPTYLYWLGEALNRRRRFRAASVCLEKAATLQPRNAEIFTQLSKAYASMEDFARAKNAASRAVEFDGSIQRRGVLLDVLERSGKLTDAIEVVESMLRDTPLPPESEFARFYKYRLIMLRRRLVEKADG
jgi:hypothetical protein